MSEVKTPSPPKSRPAPGGSLSERVQSLRLPPPGRSAGSPVAWFLCVLLLATSLAAGSAAIYFRTNWESTRRELDTTKAELSELETAQSPGRAANGKSAGPGPGTIVLESKGYIIPEHQILVSPQVSGRVIELNFDAGQQVDQGFVLAVLDSTEYRADLARTKAAVELAHQQLSEALVGNRPDEIRQAEAELAETKTNLDQSLRNLNRKKELRDKNIVTAQDFDDAQAQYDALAKRFDKLSAAFRLMQEGPRIERKKIAAFQVQQADAELTRAQWRLDNCTITAPISGTILKKNAELGNLVNPVAFNGSYSLCDMADLSKLEIDLSIQERDISKVFKGQKCRVRAEAFPDRFYDGVVSRLMPIADRAKGAVPVRVRITVPKDEEGIFLKPEMGAIVTFYQETSDMAADSETGVRQTFSQPAEKPASALETTVE